MRVYSAFSPTKDLQITRNDHFYDVRINNGALEQATITVRADELARLILADTPMEGVRITTPQPDPPKRSHLTEVARLHSVATESNVTLTLSDVQGASTYLQLHMDGGPDMLVERKDLVEAFHEWIVDTRDHKLRAEIELLANEWEDTEDRDLISAAGALRSILSGFTLPTHQAAVIEGSLPGGTPIQMVRVGERWVTEQANFLADAEVLKAFTNLTLVHEGMAE